MANARTYRFEAEAIDGDGIPLLNREAVRDLFEDLESSLFRVGGMFSAVAIREEIGEVDGRPVAATVGVHVEYQTFAPMAPRRAGAEQQPAPAEGDEAEDGGAPS